MQITTALKGQIQAEILATAARKGCKPTRHATELGINPSVYSRITGGDVDKVMGDAQWIRVAQLLDMPLEGIAWKTAQTETYKKITAHLNLCRKTHASLVFCDEKGIGKSYTARQFSIKHPDVCYVDCSRINSKAQLIRAIAKGFGFQHKGRINDVWDGLIDGVLVLAQPLIVLDEAGDMPDSCFSGIKSLWNSVEGFCGWYMMGAIGLRAKIDRKMAGNRIGFEEVFDRFGAKYQSCIAQKTDVERSLYRREQAEQVLAANRPGIGKKEANDLINRCELSLRRLYLLIHSAN